MVAKTPVSLFVCFCFFFDAFTCSIMIVFFICLFCRGTVEDRCSAEEQVGTGIWQELRLGEKVAEVLLREFTLK